MRFHGRGGEGVKLTARIVSRALFRNGFTVQDSPLYGAERRGAPVVAFVRFARGPILERGYVAAPDVLVVLDDTLLDAPEAAVWEGVSGSEGVVLVNTSRAPSQLSHGVAIGRLVALDITSLCLDLLGRTVLSAPMAAFTAKATGLASWEQVEKAIEEELEEIDAGPALRQRNLVAARRAFDAAPTAGWKGTGGQELGPVPAGAPFEFPVLPGAWASPSVWRPGTSALRDTSGWRVFRPVIDRARCTRCFLCFVLCPEGAIHLDAEQYPVVDETHCKGCLVCAEECPPEAIAVVREVQP